jgi:hypothetical protein
MQRVFMIALVTTLAACATPPVHLAPERTAGSAVASNSTSDQRTGCAGRDRALQPHAVREAERQRARASESAPASACRRR